MDEKFLSVLNAFTDIIKDQANKVQDGMREKNQRILEIQTEMEKDNLALHDLADCCTDMANAIDNIGINILDMANDNANIVDESMCAEFLSYEDFDEVEDEPEEDKTEPEEVDEDEAEEDEQ